MEWISVEERLPEENGHYLVYEVCAHGGMVSLFEQHLNGRAIWYKYDSEYGDFEVTGVTHWMPLPPPPEQ